MLRPIQLDPALIGQPLPCDLFSETGVLLAGAGMPLVDEAHFQKLAARQLYRQAAPGAASIEPLRRLSDIARHTNTLFAGPEEGLSEEELRLLARAFLALFRIDPNACLGYPRLTPIAPPALSHSLHVLFISILLADQMEFSEAQTESLAAAALTMNMADPTLQDRYYSGLSNAADLPRLQAHPTAAAAMLARAGVTDTDWLDNVRQHHENLDGSGYPANLNGSGICLAARILHVAEVYCSKINARYYRPPKSSRLAFKELFGTERHHIDTQIASLLLRRIGMFPPGTLVRLANRESACITRLGRNGQIRFAVSFLDARGRPLESPRERDLSSRIYAVRNLINVEPLWPKINWSQLWGY